MAKRFTDTNKWADPWFRRLSPAYKLAWLYLLDNCDIAGVIDLDGELASFQIGSQVDWDDFVAQSQGRVDRLKNGKLWLTKFIAWQYGELSQECRPHKAVINLIEKHDIERLSDSHERLSANADSLKDKDKDKDKDQDKDLEGGVGETKPRKPRPRFVKPTVDEVTAYCQERGNFVDPERFVDFYQSKGWLVGESPMKDWQACVRTWEKSSGSSRGSPTYDREAENAKALAALNALDHDQPNPHSDDLPLLRDLRA